MRTSLLFGMLNAAIGLWGTWLLQPLLHGGVTGLRIRAAVVLLLLGIGFIKADLLTALSEEGSFADEIIYARSTPYQRIIITRGRAGFQLFLNGHLQFSSADEYRYHEALVHPAMMLAESPRRVLILGGGDGLALREVLKHAVRRRSHARRSRSRHDRAIGALPAAGRTESALLPRSARACRQSGRDGLAGIAGTGV